MNDIVKTPRLTEVNSRAPREKTQEGERVKNKKGRKERGVRKEERSKGREKEKKGKIIKRRQRKKETE